jgi:hypothetical protein
MVVVYVLAPRELLSDESLRNFDLDKSGGTLQNVKADQDAA